MLFTRPGEIQACGMFSLEHLILFSITILAIMVALHFTRNIKKCNIKKIIIYLTIILWILEIIKIVYNVKNNNGPNSYIPLYYCSILLYAGIFSGYAKGYLKIIGDIFIATGGIIGGLVFLIFPSTSLVTYPMLHFISIHSFIFHGIMVYLGILVNITNYVVIKKQDIKYYASIILIISLIAYIINQKLGTNLMFISENFQNIIVGFIYKTTGKFFTITMILLQAIIPFYIIYFIRKIYNKFKGGIKMERKVRVVQFGTGKMAKYTMRYVFEKGGEVVGAVDINPAVIGKDIGEVIGGETRGVYVTALEKAEEMLKEVKPDICVVETMSLLADLEEPLMLCAKLGINAITTCEEAFFPWNSNPNLTKKIDKLAKQTGCTITGTGYQDIYWGQLITSIAGSTQKITKIKGSSSYNVEDYGIALAKAHGSGLTLKEFDEQIASVDKISDEERNKVIESGEYLPSYMWNTNGWLCSKLGLTVKSQTQVTVPQTYEKDIYSETLGMTVKAGDATGMSAVVTTETEEGITIQSECIGKVYSSEDYDKNEWTVYGEPDTTITVARPATVELTCATIVNRIPDVINAEPGYITTDKLGELQYKVKNLNEYVK